MPGEDLFFRILAKDDASKTFKSIADSADHTGSRLTKLSTIMAAMGSGPGLGAAAFGGIMGMPAVAGAAGAAMATLQIATNGVGDAFTASGGDAEEYAAALGKLAPNAAAFVREGVRVNGVLADFRGNVQGQFFAPLLGAADQLAHSYMPILGRQVPALSGDLGRAARSWTSVVTEGTKVRQVEKILDSSRVVVRNLSDTTNSLTGGFIRLTAVGGKFGERITKDFASAAGAWERFLARAEADGSLDRMLDTAADSAHELGVQLAPLGAAVYNLFSSSGAAAAAQTFFAILGTGAKVVTIVVNAFAALPDGVQSTIVVLGAAGIVAFKTFGIIRAGAASMAATAVTMQALGPAGAAAARGMTVASTAATRLAGPVGLALGVLAMLVTTLGSAEDRTAPLERDLSKLGETVKTFADSGRLVGEWARVSGGSMDSFLGRIREVGDAWNNVWSSSNGNTPESAARRNAAIGAEMRATGKDFAQLANEHKRAMNTVNADLAAYDKTLADLARGGDVKTAATLFAQFSDAAQRQGYDLQWVNSKMVEYRSLMGDLTVGEYDQAVGAQQLAAQQRTLNGTWQEGVNQLGNLTSAFDVLNGRFLSAREAEIAAEAAAKNFADAIKASAGSLDERTDKGRAAESALINLAKATAVATQKTYDDALAHGTQAEALAKSRSVFEEHRKQLIDAAIAAGIDEKAAKALADQYLKMPTGVTTTVTAPGTVQATSEVERLRDRMRELRDKIVKVEESGAGNAAQRVAEFNRQLQALNSRTVYLTMVENRISKYEHDTRNRGSGGIDIRMASGGITNDYTSRWLRSPTILAGERGTEAYISMTAPKARSRSILRDAAEMLGGPQSIWPGMGGGGDVAGALDRLTSVVLGGGRSYAQIGFTAQGGLAGELIRLLRPEIAAQGGDVQFVLGTSGR